MGRQVAGLRLARQVLDWPARVMGHQVLRLVRSPYGAPSVMAQIGLSELLGAECRGSDWPDRPLWH